MVVDILVVNKDPFWPTAWGVKFLDNCRVLVIYENPFNPHARGEKRVEMVVEGLEVEVYENQGARVWAINELEEFLKSLDDTYEVEMASDLADLPFSFGKAKWWTTDYPIYM